EGWIELIDQLDHLLKLLPTVDHREVSPNHLSARKGFDGLESAAHLHFGLRTAAISQTRLGLLQLTLMNVEALLSKLIADDLFRLQQIWKRRWHVTNFVAGGFRMPPL